MRIAFCRLLHGVVVSRSVLQAEGLGFDPRQRYEPHKLINIVIKDLLFFRTNQVSSVYELYIKSWYINNDSSDDIHPTAVTCADHAIIKTYQTQLVDMFLLFSYHFHSHHLSISRMDKTHRKQKQHKK